jgi:hypothetical protein
MSYNIAKTRNALPVPEDQYGNPGAGGTYDYHSTVALNPPADAAYADITLYYQGTSWEYVQFLWLANDGQNAFLGEEGVNFLDAWINADPAAPMVPPYVMATATWGDNTCTPTEQTEVTCDDGIDNDCDGLVDGADPDCAGCTPTSATDVTCDGIDDDCNGLIDDGYVPLDIFCGIGECTAPGTIECVDGSTVEVCIPGDPLPEGPDGDPTCSDTLDNDCDGDTDLNDADCQPPVDCSVYGDKGSCNNDPVCRWNNKNKVCLPR